MIRWPRARRLFNALVVVALVVAAAATAAPAHAGPTPPPASSGAVSAKMLPTWQINGVVWSQAIVHNTVYVTGSFTKARPPGVPVGGPGEVPAGNLFAFDLTTGERVASFNHSLDAQGLVISASPDGSRVYVGGDFSTVNGIPRGHVAAFSTTDNSLVASWAPNVGGQVRGFGVTSDTVYVGGNFPSANGVAKSSLAAFAVSNGAMSSWSPTSEGSGGYVWTMTMSPDSSRVLVGGSFTSLNGATAYGMGALDAATGATLPWAAQERIRSAGLNGAITSLKTDGEQVYGSGYAFGAGAAFEGTFAADPTTGAINWVNDCLGDTYDTFVLNQAMYSVAHSHNCTVINEFPDTNPRARWQKAMAAPIHPTGTITNKDAYGWDFRGLPYAGLLQWYPDLEFGRYTSSRQAAWSVSGSGDYLVLAGEFPMVNGIAQQGLVRFANRGVAGPSQKPAYSAGMNPTVTSTERGTARLRFNSTWDRDDKALTYDVYRDGGASIATLSEDSVFWKLPSVGYLDSGLEPGSNHTYKIRVKDNDGNVQWSLASAPVTVSDSDPASSAYTQAVRTDGATHLWKLGDTGPAIVDTIGFADGTSSSATFGADGAMADDTAVSNPGGANPKLFSTSAEAHPTAVTVEAWVKTSTTSGGRILGFGDSASGTSGTGTNDTVMYIDNLGRANFALYNGTWRAVTSAKAVNDGQWHHLAATADGSGTSLFVDGRRVGRDQSPVSMNTFAGYWRILADQTSGLPNKPSSAALAGWVDEVAVYPSALSQKQLQDHYTASGRAANWSVAPTDAYGTAVSGDAPDLYWRLNEAAGTTASDASASGQNGALAGSVTWNAAGAVAGGTAAAFDGKTGVVVNTQTATSPSKYSAELWFKSTSTAGGKLIGFGNAASGNSTKYDRQVVLLNTGRLQFGVNPGTRALAETTTAFNDGQWHHVVATQSTDGMKLYVDSVLAASNAATTAQSNTGYWRVGGDVTFGGTSSNFVNATIDEVAVYPSALPAEKIEAHFTASGRELANKPPTAAFTHTESDLVVALDASASKDPDGTIASYEWNFGDGSTGTGVAAQHTYGAAGSYTVTLTVTDDKGAIATKSQSVPVVANQAPTASFTHTANLRTVSVDGSASSDPEHAAISYAWNFGDGGTATSATADHTYATDGAYEVTLTVTDAKGAQGTVAHEVTVTAPVNRAPTAAFAHTEAALKVDLDASESTDPDGTIAAYSWTFGDGGTATGVAASHTYAMPGTFPVTLTVTDDGGETSTTEVDVTVEKDSVYAQDDFARTVANGWGTADTGGAWSVSGTTSRYSVADGTAKVNVATGSSSTATLPGVSESSTEVSLILSTDKAPTGGGQYFSVIGRQVNATTDYRVKVRASGGGGVTLYLVRTVNGAETILKTSMVGGLTYNPGDQLRVRLQVTGTSPTTLQAKVWKDGAAEPASWQGTTTDATAALQTAGAVGVSSYLSASTTNGPVTFAYNQLWVGPVLP